MNYDDFVKQIMRHEGYRDHVYYDSLGIPTGGYGHAFIEGSKIPPEVSQIFLHHDLGAVESDYSRLNLPIAKEDNVRRFVIKNMLFNIGLNRLQGFKKMLAAIRSGDYETAADEMLDSKWARQVKARAVELSAMMRSGEYNSDKWR